MEYLAKGIAEVHEGEACKGGEEDAGGREELVDEVTEERGTE